MGFLDNLRMANIFGGSKPFGMPDLSAGGFNPDVVRETLNQAVPLINAAKDRDFQHQFSLMHPPTSNPAGSSPNMNLLNAIAAQNNGSSGGPLNVKWDAANDSASEQNVQKRSIFNQKNDLASEKLAQGDEGLGIKKQRADTYDYQIKNPIGKIVPTKGGDYQKIDPRTGDVIDTGADTGTLSEADAIAAKNKGRVVSPSSRGILPTQTRAQYLNSASKIKNTDPDLGQFITVNRDGTFSIMAPSDDPLGHHGPTRDQYDKINKSIYGDSYTPSLGGDPKDPLGLLKKDDEEEE